MTNLAVSAFGDTRGGELVNVALKRSFVAEENEIGLANATASLAG